MKIHILGSGGGEGYPALFCNCEHCRRARSAGGKSLRSLSQALIDGKLLIDLPAASHAHCLNYGISLGDIQNILITHTHADHYVPSLLDTRGSDFAHDLRYEKLNIYGNAEVGRKFEKTFEVFPIRDEIRKGIVLHEVAAFVPFTAGEYKVTPLTANHATEDAFNYIVDDGKARLLYLLDTGYPFDDTLDRVVGYGKKFDCVIMDCTMGIHYYEKHMNFEQNKKLKNYLCAADACDKDTRFIISHITHNHAGLHEEIESLFVGSGIEVAYDGMIAEV